jgi:hypothetical protein
MPLVVQRSLAGGEVTPAVWGRVDQAKVQTGLARCRNFMVQRFGGVTNRPGTRFIDEVDDSADAHRLIDFVSGDTTAYLLVFGDLTMRVVKNGVTVESSPGVPYSLATPYAAADLRGLQVAQDGDRMRIAHRSYAPRELVRTSDTSWALSVLTFIPDQGRPTALTATPAGAGAVEYRYQVTAVSADSEESLPAIQAAKTITGATQANPCVITATAHGYSNGDEVWIDGIVGMTQLNGRAFTIANVAANTFELVDENSTTHTAYASGGSAYRTSVRFTGATITTTSGNTVSWAAVAGAARYNVYKAVNGVFGYIGSAKETSFIDLNIAAATIYTPPNMINPFRLAGDYPGVVGAYQQRSAFASTDNDTNRTWLSRVGMPENFTTSSPIQDDDAIDFTLSGRRVSEVRHLVEVRTLVMLTSTGAWTIQGDQAGTLRPSAINPKQEEHTGAASTPPPVIVGDSVLYVQARGTTIRDLNFDAGRDGYTGGDLTLFAGHLFDSYSIVAMAFAAVPHSVVWVVRSDGVLLGLTFLRDQQVWGWHRHDTGAGDIIEDVAVVPEGGEDVVYLLVKRTVDGATVRYIERMQSRQIDDLVTDAWFVDGGLQYDGRNTSGTTLTLSGGTTWTYGEPLTLTASTGIFSAGEVGNTYRLRRLGQTVDVEVAGYTSNTAMTVAAVKTVPTELRNQATTDWDRCVDEIAGLDHLEGREVAILADGGVQPPQTVTAGAVPLAHDAAVVTVGLPIEADIETLDIEQAEGGSLLERKKRVNRAVLLVESSRGLWAGPDEDHMREWKMRDSEIPGQAPGLFTGTVEIPVSAMHTNGGRLVIQQRDPLPLSVLAIAPGVDLGGGA